MTIKQHVKYIMILTPFIFIFVIFFVMIISLFFDFVSDEIIIKIGIIGGLLSLLSFLYGLLMD